MFSNITNPLIRLTKKDSQKIFEDQKKHLISAPLVSYPLPGGRFILDRRQQLRYWRSLVQLQNGHERLIGYFSKDLLKTIVGRRKLLAVVKSVEHFPKYLYGRNFHLITDHALNWLLRFKNL